VTAWNNLKIRAKLSLGFGAILAIIATIAVFSFTNRSSLRKDETQQDDVYAFRKTLMETKVAHYEWLTAIGSSVFQDALTTCSVEPDPEKCDFSEWLGSTDRTNFENVFPEEKDRLNDLEKNHAALHATFVTMKLAAEEGKTLPTGTDIRQQYAKVLSPQTKNFMDNVNQIQKPVDEKINTLNNRMKEFMTRTQYMMLGLFIITLLIGLSLSQAIVRSIVPPLHSLVSVADEIAAGELKQWRVDVDRSDEIGGLYRSFSHMHARLLDMAQTLQKTSEGQLNTSIAPTSPSDIIGNTLYAMIRNLRDLAGSIANGATTLAASSAETAASATQLSASTTESAATISETTATMEEVRQTASIMSNNASSVAENARQGGAMANQSRDRVKDISDAIKLISSRMDFIAQHTVQLSEKSQKIGEIISVVNDIADQSNILAVNASIEAAKAGEEGRGFAVLAEEIRNLAEQSKQATKEIKAILDDIQKATAATVMATEEGSKAVAKGEQQAETVSKVILDLASSVSNSSRSADTIASSAREQLKGIEQVTQAMESIRTASQQNKESARQLDETSSSMKNLGQDLMRLVQRFKL
jgi:methyl-accepting chemotaxis protein